MTRHPVVALGRRAAGSGPLALLTLLVLSLLPMACQPAGSSETSGSNAAAGGGDPWSVDVGFLDFETSGSPEAQEHFLRGVAILHSFGYKQAIEQFKQAQELDPDFALAYWGESFCYNHPAASGARSRIAARRSGAPRRDARRARRQGADRA